MWQGAAVAAAFLLLGACAQDTEQDEAQTEEFAKAAEAKGSADRAAGRRNFGIWRKAWLCGIHWLAHVFKKAIGQK